jgi:hypothetical protein
MFLLELANVVGRLRRNTVLNAVHCYVTGAMECNGNHISYTATGPLHSQEVPKSEFRDSKPGNYVRHKTLSRNFNLNCRLPGPLT